MVLRQNHENRRAHLVDVKLAHKVLLALREVGLVDDGNPLGLQFDHEVFVNGFASGLLLGHNGIDGEHERFRFPTAQLLLGFFDGKTAQTLDAGIPHPKKLVQVVGKNAQEPDALNQRNTLVFRFLQHPTIETQPA